MASTVEKVFDQKRFLKAIARTGVKTEALGNKRIRFACSSCGESNKVTVEQIARQAKVACPGCKSAIALLDKDSGFAQALKAV